MQDIVMLYDASECPILTDEEIRLVISSIEDMYAPVFGKVWTSEVEYFPYFRLFSAILPSRTKVMQIGEFSFRATSAIERETGFKINDYFRNGRVILFSVNRVQP